jgi:hypothetical protein
MYCSVGRIGYFVAAVCESPWVQTTGSAFSWAILLCIFRGRGTCKSFSFLAVFMRDQMLKTTREHRFSFGGHFRSVRAKRLLALISVGPHVSARIP